MVKFFLKIKNILKYFMYSKEMLNGFFMRKCNDLHVGAPFSASYIFNLSLFKSSILLEFF